MLERVPGRLTPAPSDILGKSTSNKWSAGNTELAQGYQNSHEAWLFGRHKNGRENRQTTIEQARRAQACDSPAHNEHNGGMRGATYDGAQLKQNEEGQIRPLYTANYKKSASERRLDWAGIAYLQAEFSIDLAA